MSQSDQSGTTLTVGQVHAAVYNALTGLGITPASAAHATGRVVQALLEPELTFELDRRFARETAAAKRGPRQAIPAEAVQVMTQSDQTNIRATVTYDIVEVGHSIITADALDLERWKRSDIVLTELNLEHRLRCGPPFCSGGERPLSLEMTRWAITLERVDSAGRRLTR